MTEDDIEAELNVEQLVELGSLLISHILERASAEKVKGLIDDGAPLWFQDEDGLSALHAACFNEDHSLVQSLIERGAVWNSVDNEGNTAADIALSLNDSKCYRIIRDAGIRSEFLLHHLGSRNEAPVNMILRASDLSAAGSTEQFLNTKLRYTRDQSGQDICLAKVGENVEIGVMMGWERNIMQETATRLYEPFKGKKEGVTVLNVGFGLGIIDTLFQQLPVPPARHVIIEPHPDVLQHMHDSGWHTKPGVTIIEGKWQDFIESEEITSIGGFDIVYTDTFSEDYLALKQFFDYLPDLLSGPDARFGFFNGLGATNPTFYDVYTQVAELHLQDIGLQISWYDLDVDIRREKWASTREYFSLPIYRMPICSMAL